MSRDNPPQNEEKLVPMGVVVISIAAIIMMTCAGIWLVAPATVSWAAYNVSTAFMSPEQAQALPTPASVARVPDFLLRKAEQLAAAAATPAPPAELEVDAGMISMADAEVVDPDDGIPTRIVIPSIELDAPVSAIGLESFDQGGATYYRWQVPDKFEAGWHNSSQPLGIAGNTVLNGHHNVFGEVFRYLVDLEPGDTIILYDDDEQFEYQVTEKEIIPEKGQPLEVRLANAHWIEQTDDERVTMVTCWPYETNSHRLVVVAKPVTSSLH